MRQAAGYRGLLCDLDGVVYRGREACPGAVEGLRAAREAGVRVLFMTNNAGHTPDGIAEHLTELGVRSTAQEVLTSSQVAAGYLVDREKPRSLAREAGRSLRDLVLAVGGPGVTVAMRRAGLAVVTARDLPDPTLGLVWAVVQGYGPEVDVRDLTEATYAVNQGALWVATNSDATLPTPRGLAPGNGSLVAAVSHATGRPPDVVVGKPYPTTYHRALAMLDLPVAQVLAVGDRLETDIAGARAAGLATALVLTGVHGRPEAAAAVPTQRPDMIVDTLEDLTRCWE